jgi:hypothetical protein
MQGRNARIRERREELDALLAPAPPRKRRRRKPKAPKIADKLPKEKVCTCWLDSNEPSELHLPPCPWSEE